MDTRSVESRSLRRRLFRRPPTQRAEAAPSAASPPAQDGYSLDVMYDPALGEGRGCSDSLVDLVFVHGLGGGQRRTWTATGATVPWIQDATFLGDIKNCVRVLSFGYNANRFADVASTRIIDHANSLLRNLVRQRRTCPDRPIVFITHSLGGLVVKEAILLCPSQKDWELLKASVASILFLGTPHFGSQQAKNLELAQRLVAVTQLKSAVQTDLTQELHMFSNALMDINVRFTDYVRKSIDLFCFYETLPQWLPSGHSEIIVPKWSAVLPGVDNESSNSTHSELPKFSNPADPRFTSFWGEVSFAVHKATASTPSKALSLHVNTSAVALPTGPSSASSNGTLSETGMSDLAMELYHTPGPPPPYVNRTGKTKRRHEHHKSGRGGAIDEVGQDNPSLGPTLDVTSYSVVGDVHSTSPEVDLAKLDMFLARLAEPSPHNLLPDIMGPHPSTCGWVNESPAFKNWLEAERGGILFITGQPRCGKTHLANYLRETLERNGHADRIVLTFFCGYLENTESDPPLLDHFLRGLLNQRVELFHQVLQRFGEPTKAPKDTPSFQSLMSLLQSLLSNPAAGEVVFVLDGLDQCPNDFVFNFLKGFDWLLQSRKAPQQSGLKQYGPKLVVLSRPTDAVMGYCPKHFHLHLTPETIANDIEVVVREDLHHIFTARRFDADEEAVRNLILEKAKGDFLYATQVSQDLLTLENTGEIFSRLDRCPPTMELIYQNELDLLKGDEYEDMRLLLDILAFSVKDLTCPEAKDILRIRFPGFDPDFDLQYRVNNICPGLIRVGAKDILELRHYTLKEFLRSKQPDSRGHMKMARLCLDYLLQWNTSRDKTLRPTRKTHPFWQYAAFSWAAHSRLAGTAGLQLLGSLESFFGSTVYAAWDFYTEPNQNLPAVPEDWEPDPVAVALAAADLKHIMTAFLFGSSTSVTALILDKWGLFQSRKSLFGSKSAAQISALVNATDRDGRTPLSHASEGDGDTLILLLPYVADVNRATNRDQTPLHFAAFHGKASCVDQLVKAGAKINLRDFSGSTALILACDSQQYAAVQTLLAHGADPNILTNTGISALEAAIRQDDAKSVRLLLKHGADVSKPMSEEGRPPMFYAYRYDSDDTYSTLQELLPFAGVNDTFNGYSLIHNAALWGDVPLVTLLLDHGAVVDEPLLPHIYGLEATPLHIATSRGHGQVALKLIESGAKVDSPKEFVNGPLHNAVWSRLPETCEALILGNCDISAPNSTKMTPLCLACIRGDVDLVKLLLAHNALTNPPDDAVAWPTALRIAAGEGWNEITELLLAADPPARVNDVSHIGTTALGYAARKGFLDCVKILVDHGADIDVRHLRETPLAHAVDQGNIDIALFLISRKARIQRTGEERWSVIHLAAEDKSLELVRELLKASGDPASLINLENSDMGTPLCRAAKAGSIDVVKELLAQGADVDYHTPPPENPTGGGNSAYPPIHEACVAGSLEIFELIHSSLVGKGVELTNDFLHDLLLVASDNGREAIFDRLVELGAEVQTNAPALLRAAAFGGSKEILTKVLAACPNVSLDEQNADGYTALHFAALNEHNEMVGMLLEKGANPNLTSHEYHWSPLQRAIANDDAQTMATLLRSPTVNLLQEPCGPLNWSILQRALTRRTYHSEIVGGILKAVLSSSGETSDVVDALLAHQDVFGLDGMAYANPWLGRRCSRTKLLNTALSCVQQLYGMPHSERSLFPNILGWALLALDQTELATKVAATDIRIYGNVRTAYHDVYCDGCLLEDIESTRYICLSCPEVDLCQECMDKYDEGKLRIRRCEGHKFHALPLPDLAEADFHEADADDRFDLWIRAARICQDLLGWDALPGAGQDEDPDAEPNLAAALVVVRMMRNVVKLEPPPITALPMEHSSTLEHYPWRVLIPYGNREAVDNWVDAELVQLSERCVGGEQDDADDVSNLEFPLDAGRGRYGNFVHTVWSSIRSWVLV